MTAVRLQIGSIETPQLGEVWVAMSACGLAAVEFGVSRSEFAATLQRQFRGVGHSAELDVQTTQAATGEIAEYLRGTRHDFRMPIDWTVLRSDFQRIALQAVFAIPYGEVRTYADIAAQIGYPQAPRAVGRANATNPMPLVIPCHRVLGLDGKLHGYGGCGGLITKQWLLDMEHGAVRPKSARRVYEPALSASSEMRERRSARRRKS